MALVGVAPIGNATEPFNEKLRALVDKLNTDLEDAQFIYVNASSVSRPAGTWLHFCASLFCCDPVICDISLVNMYVRSTVI